jgi:integrase
MATKTMRRVGGDTPITMRDLYRKAWPVLWKNNSWGKLALIHVEEADEIMGRPLLSEINTDLVDQYKRVISEHVAPSTVNRKMVCLHKLLKYAHQREYIQRMPVFSWNPENNERVRWLRPGEESALLWALPREMSAFCEILIHTGMRRGELLSLKPEDIDGNYARLWKTKTGKPRSVPLTDRAKELLLQYVPFKLTINQINRQWNKAKKDIGLEKDKDFVLHTLRHTTATRMLDATGNIAVVQKMLGHSKITTTMRYAHISDDSLLDAVRLTNDKRRNVATST